MKLTAYQQLIRAFSCFTMHNGLRKQVKTIDEDAESNSVLKFNECVRDA